MIIKETYKYDRWLIVAWVTAIGCYALRPIQAFDTFWQLQSGQYIWQTGRFIYHDIFSQASEVFRLEHCWLHDIFLYIAYVTGGYPLLSLLKPLIIALCGGLLLRWAIRRGVELAYALPPLTLCLSASAASWLIRPQLWTFLFALLYLHLLYLGRERGMRAWLWLTPLMLVWANLHAACIFGFALIAAFWVGEFWRSLRGTNSWRSLGSLTICGLLAFGVSFVNPYGYRIPVEQILGQLNQRKVASGDASIGLLGNMEWLPPSFEAVPWFYVVMALWGGTILWRLLRRRMDVAELVCFLGFSYMGFSQIRHTTLVSMLAGYYMPVAFQDVLKPLLSRTSLNQKIDKTLKWGTMVVLFCLVLITWNQGALGVGLKKVEYPVDATKFLTDHKLPTNLYNAYDWGGYLMWQLYPDYLVFVDGRTTSNKLFSASVEIENIQPGWENVLDEYGIRTIITRTCFSDTGGPLNLIDGLSQSSRWALVYSDDVAVIYLRKEFINKNFITQYAQPMKNAYATMYAEASRLYAEDRSRKRSLLAIGRSSMRLGQHTEALNAYQKFLKYHPEDQEAKRAVSLLGLGEIMNESLPTFVRTHFLPLLLMLMLAFCVFGNTLGHDWTYDDFPVVVENPDVKSWSGFLENRYPGRPIREITYLVDHTLFGSNPSGYHGQSILWHCLAGFLIYRVMVALGLGGVAGLLSGILFIVHPITVEAVANVSHRKESLSLVFSLLALLTYQRAFKTSSLSWLFVLGSFGFAAIAFMSKQTAVCLPFAFLAYEWVFVDRERWKLLRCWKALIGLTSVGVAGGLFWMWTNGGVDRYIVGFQGLLQSKSNYFGPAQFDVYFQTLLKSWAFSFSKLLLPVELSAEYIIVPPQGWLTPWVLSGLMLVIGISVALLWAGYRRSPLFFWLILGGSFYLPVSNVWPLAYLAADRYLYVPWAAASMAFAWLICKYCPRPVMASSLVTGIVIVLTLLTWQQNRVWASPDALWTHALKVNPKSSFVLNNVGNLHLLRNDDAGALSYYRKAIKVNPINPTAWYNLGYIFESQRNMPLAIKYYQQFINVAEGPWMKDVQRLQSHLLIKYRVQLKRGPFDPSIMPP